MTFKSAGETVDMDTMCLECGRDYGEHHGFTCPGPKRVPPCAAHDAAAAREALFDAAEAEPETQPCRSPYCECPAGKCGHPGYHDARGTVQIARPGPYTPRAGLPTDAAERKAVPIFSGVIRYFPDALAAVAECSKKGNDQHNPGKPLHWDRSKSGDELDALTRHLVEAGTVDTDGIRHSTKVAWRALANLQKEIELSRKENHG